MATSKKKLTAAEQKTVTDIEALVALQDPKGVDKKNQPQTTALQTDLPAQQKELSKLLVKYKI